MRRIVVLLTLGVLVLAGCAADPATSSGEADAAAPLPVGTGKVADLDFSATTLSGEAFDGTALRGRPTVLWFWAPWCPTCRAQIPGVTRLAERHAGEVAVVGVGGLDDRAVIEELAGQIPEVTHLVDPEGEVWKHFGVTSQSSYTVIDAEGEILVEGFLDDAAIADLVDRLAA
ncbi:redoxin family protein [Nocardioides coralli]|uniref:redoxin family protein n=1 Tax=Nocardioides coralli TaxID=2872154 RepID=UPI001CA3A7D8|nr:redoxin family protein [Nocardioides coralli]QZY29123.1 redoxin family protein [Nocardioides coralli]